MTDTSRALKYEAVTPVRWSSSDAGDRSAVENPATGEIITDVQGSCWPLATLTDHSRFPPASTAAA